MRSAAFFVCDELPKPSTVFWVPGILKAQSTRMPWPDSGRLHTTVRLRCSSFRLASVLKRVVLQDLSASHV